MTDFAAAHNFRMLETDAQAWDDVKASTMWLYRDTTLPLRTMNNVEFMSPLLQCFGMDDYLAIEGSDGQGVVPVASMMSAPFTASVH